MKAIAPGKLILSGEHAVVYGKPAIAMAIDRAAVFEILPRKDSGIAFDLPQGAGIRSEESFTLLALRDLKRRIDRKYRRFLAGEIGIRDVVAMPADLFRFAFINALDGLHRTLDSGLCLRLRSGIPAGCGLGSSAATILSELRALGHYLRVEFRPDWYYEYSLEVEKLQHGRPSGVDTYVSLHGGCARFHAGAARPLPLLRLRTFLVQTGVPETTTGECVEAVRRGFSRSAIWSEFEGVTNALEGALRDNDETEIRRLVRENNRLLCAIGVVPEKVRRFVADVEARGGAAKVCGAGATDGENAGAVLLFADRAPRELCARYGYDVSPVRGDPLGTRIVGA